jgi:hypothetical protein
LKTIQLNTGELVITTAKNLDPAFYPKNKIRKLSIIDRIPGASVARIAEFSDEESLVQLRDLLLELLPLDYKAYDEAEIADPNGPLADDMRALGELVHRFAAAMRHKLYEKAAEGYTGWNNPENIEMIQQKLLANAERGDWVDVANLAAMLWNQEQSSYEGIRRLKAGPGGDAL